MAAGTVTVVAIAVFASPLRSVFSGNTAGGGDGAPRDWLILAEFEGNADATERSVARELVRTTLDQSTIVATLPRDQIERGLSLAGMPDTTRLGVAVARELAERGSIRTVLTGQIDRVGETYAIVLRVVDAEDGTVVVSEHGIASGDDDLIPTVDGVARAVRAQLGERRDAIRASRRLIEAATPSLAAYRKFREGVELAGFVGREELGYFREALELDPDFAKAWAFVGVGYGNVGHTDSALASYAEALKRPERLTEEDVLWVQGAEARMRNDYHTAYRFAEEQARKYGNGSESCCALLLREMGRLEEALERDLQPGGVFREFARGRRTGLRIPLPASQNLATLLVYLGRFDEAEDVIELLPRLIRRSRTAQLALVRGDWTQAESTAVAIMGDPAGESVGRRGAMGVLASVHASRGELEAATELVTRAVTSAATEYRSPGITRQHESYQLLLAIAAGRSVPTLSPLTANDTTTFGMIHRALYAAAAADTGVARRLLLRIDALPTAQRAQYGSGPEVAHAWMAAHAEQWDLILPLLAPAVRWRRPHAPTGHLQYGGIVQWLLGEAYERVGRPDSAAARFDVLATLHTAGEINHRLYPAGYAYSFANFRAGKLYAQLGDYDRAEEHWLTFLDTFTNPDPEYEWMVEEARYRLEKLARGR
jgi:tetratricopeptide (TPR) repeat protein